MSKKIIKKDTCCKYITINDIKELEEALKNFGNKGGF